jgi:hypothetical protein
MTACEFAGIAFANLCILFNHLNFSSFLRQVIFRTNMEMKFLKTVFKINLYFAEKEMFANIAMLWFDILS